MLIRNLRNIERKKPKAAVIYWIYEEQTHETQHAKDEYKMSHLRSVGKFDRFTTSSHTILYLIET